MNLQICVQLVRVMSTVVYKALVSLLLLKLVANLLDLKIDSERETQGLDLVKHD